MSLEVLHVDDTLVVTVKPAGLLSVPGRGDDKQDCMATRVQAAWPDALVVHRLDMGTSGLLVFARGKDAQRALSDAFAQRTVDKRYVAVVAGHMAGDDGEIDLPLSVDWPNRPRQQVDPERGKPSLTRWRVLQRNATTTRVALEPVTGRSHQLRVHLWASGHPILGDALYAPDPVRDAAARLLLHAEALELAHPGDGRRLAFHSATPF